MSEVEVYVECEKVVLCIDGLRMDFSPQVAQIISDMLQVHIPLAEVKVKEIREHHQSLLTIDLAIRDSLKSMHIDQRETLNSLMLDEHIDVMMRSLQLLIGEEHAHNYFVLFWCIDDRARYHLIESWKSHGFFILHAISKAPQVSEIAKLWNAGCFDDALFQYCVSGEVSSQEHLGERIVFLSHMMQRVTKSVFTMGDSSSLAWDFEMPTHLVQLSKTVMVSCYAVTQQFYDLVFGENPSQIKGPFLPVTDVSWFDALRFCNRLSEKEDLLNSYQITEEGVFWNKEANGYRLLTEAEWEAFARGGEEHQFAGSPVSEEVAWTNENSAGKPQPAGAKKANALGLYDMSGNVWEWCWDWYDATYYSRSSDRDPCGPSEGQMRVCRGGSYLAPVQNARVSIRGRFEPNIEWSGLGFRIARTIT